MSNPLKGKVPVLLLAILEQMDRDPEHLDRFPFSDNLREAFNAYFHVVRSSDDKPTIENPFFYLQNDGFWSVETSQGPLPAQVGVGRLTQLQATGRLSQDFWLPLQNPLQREILRESIINRFFPSARDRLHLLITTRLSPAKDRDALVAEAEKEAAPKRDSAFRKVVVDIYDYQCTACGLRIILPPDRITFVDAAHLIPFSESNNDHPSNGIALRKNHHWAMDRNLIAPGSDLKWKVAPSVIEQRSNGEAELMRLIGKPVLPPHDPKFAPDPESLRWREERLGA